MAKVLKWIGGALGFTFGGPIGAILGYALGSALESSGTQRTVEEFSRPYSRQPHEVGEFEISLLVLSAIVIKADGKVDPNELAFVRNHFIRMYGTERANHAFKLFNEIIKNKNIETQKICDQVYRSVDHASRLQLIHYLFGIAKSDGHVSKEEVEVIQRLAGYLHISHRDFESIKAMFYDDTGAAYQILEIEKNASDDEVKKAYRNMAKKYHPDRLQHLGDTHREAAEAKFRSVQDAYEKIKKERGMK